MMKRHQYCLALFILCTQELQIYSGDKDLKQDLRKIPFFNKYLPFEISLGALKQQSDRKYRNFVERVHSVRGKLLSRNERLRDTNFAEQNVELLIPEIDGSISQSKIRFPELLRQYGPVCPVTVTVTESATSLITIATTTTTTITTTIAVSNPVPTLAIIAIIATAVAVPISLIGLTAESDTVPIPPFPSPTSFTFIQTQPTPVNMLEIPVQGQSFPTDSCRINTVSFTDIRGQLQENGTCYPLLTRGPCGDPQFWLTLDPNTLRSRCTPRLCGRNRVFIERDGLCHDIYDPSECSGGRRLFYSAFGDPVCDCPLGKYPFPTPQDDCVALFQQGPCPQGNVVNFVKDGQLECTPSQCPANPSITNPLIPAGEDGICYGLGTSGPCRPDTQLLGYDVFELRAQCVDLTDPQSPYFSSPEEDELLDSVYNQRSAEFDDFRLSFVQPNRIRRNGTVERRQGFNTFGAFQVSSGLPNALLNPCRPGSQNSYNTKCTNPILPEPNRPSFPAVRPAFGCPGQLVLQATGQCRRPFNL